MRFRTRWMRDRGRLMLPDDLIPAELAETVDRLENWALWARERASGTVIGSAEGRYRPEREDIYNPRQPTPYIDAWDAQLVGKCLAPARGFPHRWYVMLKWRFLFRAGKPALCRKMAIHVDNYHTELRKALFAARNTLTKRKNAG